MGTKCIYYQQAVERFFDNNNYTHFFKPYSRTSEDSQPTAKQTNTVEWTTDDGIPPALLRYDECIDPNQVWDSSFGDESEAADQYASGRLGRFQVRSSDIQKNQSRMVLCSVANFAHCLEMNVDPTKKTIGQLVDPCERDSLASRAVYDEIFGTSPGVLGNNYLSKLGPELQKSPISHPTRLYDPNRAILFEALGGVKGYRNRAAFHYLRDRPKKFNDILFQAFIVEAIPAGAVYVNWTRLCRKIDKSLTGCTSPTVLVPGIQQANDFIVFLSVICNQTNRFSTLSKGSYTKDKDYADLQLSQDIIKTAAAAIPEWSSVELLPILLNRHQRKKTNDLFRICVDKAASFMCTLQGNKQSKFHSFHTQHWMMNVNEVIPTFPMGYPRAVYTAFGSEFGMQLSSDARGRSQEEVFREWLSILHNDISQDVALARGWRRDTKGRLCVKMNSRLLTNLDLEHEFCECMIVVEREPGGTRSFSKRPAVWSPIHMPIPGLFLPECVAIAKESLSAFRRMITSGYFQGSILANQVVRGCATRSPEYRFFKLTDQDNPKWKNLPHFSAKLPGMKRAVKVDAKQLIIDYPRQSLSFLLQNHATDEM